jgi:hypothetical protein
MRHCNEEILADHLTDEAGEWMGRMEKWHFVDEMQVISPLRFVLARQ